MNRRVVAKLQGEASPFTRVRPNVEYVLHAKLAQQRKYTSLTVGKWIVVEVFKGIVERTQARSHLEAVRSAQQLAGESAGTDEHATKGLQNAHGRLLKGGDRASRPGISTRS